MSELISIGKAAEMLGVSVQTLRRWDAKGTLKALRSDGKHRYFRREDLLVYTNDLFTLAKDWACNDTPHEPEGKFYCRSRDIFQARLETMAIHLSKLAEFKDTASLVGAITGEIGNISFDHNIGNWSDIPGIFFGYDLNKQQVVLADRGQGILKTLSRVKPSLKNDSDALLVAFTEVVSGRSPEARGNGLKYVKKVILEQNSIDLVFQTGEAKLELKPSDSRLEITKQHIHCVGCLALIKF